MCKHSHIVDLGLEHTKLGYTFQSIALDDNKDLWKKLTTIVNVSCSLVS